MGTNDVRAFDALSENAKLGDLVTITREVLGAAAQAHRSEWADAARVKARAEELKLTSEDAATPFGNALSVLERGPEDDAERALACALWAHAVAEARPKGREEEDRCASDALWLAAHTPFDATGLLDRALGDHAVEIWDAVADRIRRIDAGKLAPLGRGEGLIGCAALALSTSPSAAKLAAELAGDLKDRALSRVVRKDQPSPSVPDQHLRGEMITAPRGLVLTALLGITGILLIIHVVRLFGRIALAYRRPAEVTLSDASVVVRARTEMLGRTLSDREIVIVRSGLVRATREVRYPRMAFYSGLLALALGSYIGVATLVDGARAASPSLLLTGLLLVSAGIAIDFVLGSLTPGATGRCRVAFVPRTGRAVCIGGVDAKSADAALTRLSNPNPR